MQKNHALSSQFSIQNQENKCWITSFVWQIGYYLEKNTPETQKILETRALQTKKVL